MSVALRPSVRLFALVPALVAAGSIVVDFMLLEFYGVAFLLMVSLLVYVGVGLLLVQRLPRQPVGWLLLGAGALLQLATAGGAYAWAAFVRAPGTLPLGEVALILSWGWIPALGCLFTAVMLFPTGRPPSPRWRPAVALVVITTALLLVAALFSQQDLQVPQSLAAQNAPLLKVPNPLAIDGPLATLLAYGYASPFTFFVYLIPVAAVLARFRTAVGNERQQLKWFAFASSLGMSFFVVSGLVPTLFSYLSGLGPAIAIIAIDLIPISVAIAILRYRLYDIDLLIKRTLVYGATTAAIAALFWVGILALQRLLSPVTSGSEVAIAASTLASLALFQPVRRRVQDAVDRRFDRSRYNAARTVDAFADVLREEVDLDEVRADLLGSVQQTMAPAHASLWLRERAR
jgi:hypothetical protein